MGGNRKAYPMGEVAWRAILGAQMRRLIYRPKLPGRPPSSRRTFPLLSLFLFLVLLPLNHPTAQVSEHMRVATYNIKFLSTSVANEGNRLEKLRSVIQGLDADVMGLQEIADRAALYLLFNPAQHDILVDDSSGDDQDLALLVRRPCRADGSGNQPSIVFRGSSLNGPFPRQRDLLIARVACPNGQPFTIFVHHAKSRFEGRAATDSREDDPDAFAINLTEPLLEQDVVSHALTSTSVKDGQINPGIQNSRRRNNDGRGQNINTGPILFDQIFISQALRGATTAGAAKAYDGPEAVVGNRQTRASDRVPVYADSLFAVTPEVAGEIVVVAVLSDPEGSDYQDETITLKNKGTVTVSLEGWVLEDTDAHQLTLTSLSIGPDASLIIERRGRALSLNNDGDTVRLRDPQGTVRSERTYDRQQV